MTDTVPAIVLPRSVELRDPTAATRALTYTSPGMAQINEWDADQAFRLGYYANVIAYRCVQIIANAISSVPLVALRDRRRTQDQYPESPVARLLGPPPGGPAPNLSARKLLRWTIAQWIVTGRRAWEIETDGGPDGKPVAFWPLVAARLEQVPSDSGVDWFRVFKYGRQDRPRQLPPSQVFFGWDPAGLDFRQPESAFQAARYDLSLALMSDRYSVAFLRNNAVPATVVTTARFPNEDARRKFRQQWGAEFSGVDNAGRTHFFEADDDGDGPVGETIDVKVLGLSAKDARLMELRKDVLAEVAMSLGVPWSKLDASGRTFDNAEVEDRTFWQERLDPLMADLEDDINMQIAPRLGGEVVWFDRSTVRALQRKIVPTTQSVGAPALVFAQIMWINEARADYGLPPVPDGDRMMSADEITALRGAGSSGEGAVRDVLAVLEQRALPSDVVDVEVIEPAAPLALEARHDISEDPEVRRARIWRTADATVRGLESRWLRAWRKLFARQEKAVVARLTGKRGRQAIANQAEGRAPVDEVFDRGFWLDETVDEARGLYELVAAAGFARVSDVFGVAFDLEAEWAQAFIESRANLLAGQVTDTTYAAIQAALAEGVAAGEGIPELAGRVRHVFEVADQARSVTIARTEVISAFNGSATLSASTLPADVVGGREWIATRDSRTRGEHAEADGQVVAMDAAFAVGGEMLLYPGDPGGSSGNTVNCRCTVALLTPEEMSERGAVVREVRVDAHLEALFDLLHPDVDLLAWRRALRAKEAAA